MKAGESTQLVRRWFQEVWNEPRSGAVGELFAEHGRMSGVGGQEIVGRDEFRAFRDGFRAVFSEFDVQVTEAHETDDSVFIQFTIAMVHRASQRRVETAAAGWARFDNRQIIEARNFINFLEVLIQIGAAPEHALESALGGANLVVTQ